MFSHEFMIYREFTPSLPLNEFVSGIYYLRGDAGSGTYEILPDFKTDMIFLFGAGLIGKLGNSEEYHVSSPMVNGFRRSSLKFRYKGETEILGVRFLPYGCTRLFGIQPEEIAEFRPLNDLIGIRTTSQLTEQIFTTPDPKEKISIVLSWLMSILANANITNSLPIRAINRISLTHGTIPLHKICNNSPSEYKQVQRFCYKTLDISPKQLSRIIRFEYFHDCLRSPDPPDWLSLVCSLGLTDQSHLIREVKQFTGLRPKEFLASLESYI